VEREGLFTAVSARVSIAASFIVLISGCQKPAPAFQMPPTKVSVIEVSPQTIAAHYDYQGVASASKHVEVRANVTGVILRRAFVEGTDVPQGALLYQIDTTIYEAALRNAVGQLEDAKARLSNAKRNLDRLKPLLEEKAVAQKDVDDQEQAFQQGQADVVAAQGLVDQARKNLSDTQVRAQVAGRVGLANLELGARVTGPSDLLTWVDQVDPIYVSFSPPQEDLLAWRREIAEKRLAFPSGKLQVRAVLADGSVYENPGTINFADIQVATQTGTQQLRATFPNRNHVLLPGQFVRAELIDLKREGAILVPQRAVQQGLTGAYVFVVGDSNKVGIKPVQTAAWQGSQWVINDGVKAGDKVIVEGTQKIGPGMKVNPTPYNAATDSTLKPLPQDIPAAPSFSIVQRGGGTK
jgi:membrane fusion protein, multidrug efflux system